jgi:hypothetical protein
MSSYNTALDDDKCCVIHYGCDCDCVNHDPQKPTQYKGMNYLAPILYAIKRNGKKMNVCTYCNLEDDIYLYKYMVTNEHIIYDSSLEEESIVLYHKATRCYV